MTLDPARMASLATRFAERTRIDAARLAAPLDRGEMADIVHRMAGSAALFGQAAIGERAQALEAALDEGLPHEALLEALLDAIAQLD